MENKRFISVKVFFRFMVFMGIILGGSSIIFKYHSLDISVRSISDFNAFLIGFVPSIFVGVVVWLGDKSVRNKGKIPIK